ncbi:MAG TPA: sulfite exporter TauE/SafE family protein [Candidatus Dormibacteraeota bacterium]|nr:sulfite exporter TauE/SafE family protein [Candidatus Dormibacteraeota bacterium]
MDFITAFVLGLVGSLHCAGMCGPLALALPAHGNGRVSWVTGRLAYNLGRLTTYCTLGLLFGLIGRSLFLAGFQRWLSLALGVALLIGLLGSTRLGATGLVTALVSQLKFRMSGFLRRRSLFSLACLGLLNGFLPCGLVYVAAAAATATAGIISAIWYMAAFGAGTVPMMLSIGLSGRLVPIAFRLKLQKAIPISVVLLGTLLILRGLALGIPYLSPDLAHGTCCQH